MLEMRRWNKEKWWFDDSLHPFQWFETISNQKASSSLISISLHYMDPYFLKNASWDLKWVIILPSHDSTFECCQFDSYGSSYIERHKSLKNIYSSKHSSRLTSQRIIKESMFVSCWLTIHISIRKGTEEELQGFYHYSEVSSTC